tara:strand:- start:1402 stop:1770 length:369 start_codon:yes stop_codon:yes gene_type:complete
MKLNELRKVIKEEVKAAIQEELKDILLEAVRSPKTVVAETVIPQTTPQSLPETDKVKLRENMMGVLDGMKPGQDTLSFNSTDARNMGGNLQVAPGMNTSGEGSQLPAGNVGLDQIMGLMKNK